MRSHIATAALFALAAADSSRSYVQPSDSILSARDALALPYVSTIEEPFEQLVRRQNNGSSAVNLAPNGGQASMTAWDKETNDACVNALSTIQRSTNPSGNCLCYNLQSLDTSSGAFLSELRVFRISEPREGFTGISPNNINVGVQYNGASVRAVSAEEFAAMAQGKGPGSISTTRLTSREEHHAPQLLQTYQFIGQIDKDRMTQQLSMAQLEAVVTPVFTLTAQNTNGGAVSTNLSMNEASFVSGVFSKQVIRSDFAAAQAAVDAKLAAVRNGTVAFILPGVQIMIFPIGAVITSIWLALGLAAYGFGTYERSVYADTYKRRQAAANGVSVKTI
ncbi:hypothetical protein HIM_00956 [Hirsutella minnesotensis 3608]|nr:hypothetical protein HIM_00956 [Hirsutella minnesotensis 3608]